MLGKLWLEDFRISDLSTNKFYSANTTQLTSAAKKRCKYEDERLSSVEATLSLIPTETRSDRMTSCLNQLNVWVQPLAAS